MKAERKVTTWEEVSIMKCHFCGDVYAVEDDGAPDELEIMFSPKRDRKFFACELCLNEPAEPNYPDGLRPVDDE